MEQIPPRIYGLIGHPVKHSLSALMHNSAFKHRNINAEYKLFSIAPSELEDFLLGDREVQDTEGRKFSTKDIAGFNITIPHKVRAKEILQSKFPFDEKAPLAWQTLHYVRLTGSVNTVRRVGDILEYRNTDAGGFLTSLKKELGFKIKKRNALVIGCGGAGRAVIAGLSWKQSQINKIFIHDINSEAVESTRRHFSQFQYVSDKIEFVSAQAISEIISGVQLLVNASGVGMQETDPSLIDKNLLHKNLFVYDVVYNRQTQLIKDALEAGLPAVGGLGMLLYQGVGAFEIWTGENAPVEIMRQALVEGINKL